MKKVLSLLFAIVFVFILVGCGSGAEITSEPSSDSSVSKETIRENSSENRETSVDEEVFIDEEIENAPKIDLTNLPFYKGKGYEITVLGCVYSNAMKSLDSENDGGSIFLGGKKDGIYIDLVLKVKNTGKNPITKDMCSGYFIYDDLRYDMSFAVENSTMTGYKNSSEATVESGETAIAHLYRSIDKGAKNADIIVKYTIAGKEYEEKVALGNVQITLDEKTEIRIGDKVDVNGMYSMEVVDCSIKKYLRATNTAESKQYNPLGSATSFFHLLLRVKNNTQEDLTNILAYTVLDGEVLIAGRDKEKNNNTELDRISNSNPLSAGKVEYCHIYVSLEEGVKTDGLIMRINLGGNFYYCKLPE